MPRPQAPQEPFSNLWNFCASLYDVVEMGREYMYVETGRYKPWSQNTVNAAERRGLVRVERPKGFFGTGVWHVYPTPEFIRRFQPNVPPRPAEPAEGAAAEAAHEVDPDLQVPAPTR